MKKEYLKMLEAFPSEVSLRLVKEEIIGIEWIIQHYIKCIDRLVETENIYKTNEKEKIDKVGEAIDKQTIFKKLAEEVRSSIATTLLNK